MSAALLPDVQPAPGSRAAHRFGVTNDQHYKMLHSAKIHPLPPVLSENRIIHVSVRESPLLTQCIHCLSEI